MSSLYRRNSETKPSTTERKPYYIHTANGREPVNPPREPPYSSSSSTTTNSKPPPQYSPNPDSTTTLINPIHPPEICPPSTSRWQKLKDENEQRKSREVVRMGSEEVERITGRDSRGFRKGEWTEAEKDREARRVWECVVM